MSSVTRRQLLASGALVGLSASLPTVAQAKIGNALPESCPHCSANLAMGDLHKPDCIAARVAPPSDDDIKPETIKTAQAQRRSSDQLSSRSRGKPKPAGSDSCEQYGCDRCKVKMVNKGWCYHKNTHGCAVQKSC